jgi:hypothetical protein
MSAPSSYADDYADDSSNRKMSYRRKSSAQQNGSEPEAPQIQPPSDPKSEETECPICREVIVTPTLTNPCNHEFCFSCINNWTSQPDTNKPGQLKNSCPMCRSVINMIDFEEMVDGKLKPFSIELCSVSTPSQNGPWGAEAATRWATFLGDARTIDPIHIEAVFACNDDWVCSVVDAYLDQLPGLDGMQRMTRSGFEDRMDDILLLEQVMRDGQISIHVPGTARIRPTQMRLHNIKNSLIRPPHYYVFDPKRSTNC